MADELRPRRSAPPAMKSRMANAGAAFAIAYIPLHVYLVPQLLLRILGEGTSGSLLNFIWYAIDAAVLVAAEFKFLRRDFDTLCDRTVFCLLTVAASYFGMMATNMLVNIFIMQLAPAGNPNNEAIFSMVGEDYGRILALSTFLAPLAEELMFRGGLFGTLRRYSRTGAYIVTVLAFSLYHVWSYVTLDWRNIIYMLQYIPVTYLLCRCYERTDSIWTCIFFHMLVNGIALRAAEAIGQLA